MTAYKEDLTYIHDAGFSEFIRQAAPGVLELLGEHGIESGLILDLGCGGGILAQELCHAGYEVCGIDISADMIALAKARVPAAQFIHGSFLDSDLPRAGAVACLGECVNYLFDTTNCFPELERFFERIYAALPQGGVFIFDFAEPERSNSTRAFYREGPDWAIGFRLLEDATENKLTRSITTFRKIGETYRRDHETHELQLYNRNEVLSALQGIGFQVRQLESYGTWKFPEALCGLLARKS